ncbi:hypothetical protein ACWGFX_06685 [Streptomyces xanthophaeus]
MGSWRDALAEAQDWSAYRGALRALQRDSGVSFKELNTRSEELATRDIPGIRPYSVGTLNKLTSTALHNPPKWGQVEVFVRGCAEHRGEPGIEAFLGPWAAGFSRCGGDPGPRYSSAESVDPNMDVAGQAEPPRERKRGCVVTVSMTLTVGLLGGGLALTTLLGNPGGNTRPQVEGPYRAVIKWSDDDTTGQSATVKAYASYQDGSQNQVVGSFELGASLSVMCQVTGRVVPLGPAYTGPSPVRSAIWYRVDTGQWVPAAYVDTGKDSIPAC